VIFGKIFGIEVLLEGVKNCDLQIVIEMLLDFLLFL
jgi:hypothetical protein